MLPNLLSRGAARAVTAVTAVASVRRLPSLPRLPLGAVRHNHAEGTLLHSTPRCPGAHVASAWTSVEDVWCSLFVG